MVDWLSLFWALLVGAGIGVFYFGGLWWTVSQLTKAHRPGILFLTSFVVRTAISVAGFYLALGNQWQRAPALVIGFLLARLFTVRRWGVAPQKR